MDMEEVPKSFAGAGRQRPSPPLPPPQFPSHSHNHERRQEEEKKEFSQKAWEELLSMLEGLGTPDILVQLLIDESELVQLEALRLFASCTLPSTSIFLASEDRAIDNLVSLLSSDNIEIQKYSLQILCSLSNSISCTQYFGNQSSWVSLHGYHNNNWPLEYGIMYCILVCNLLASEIFALVPDELILSLDNWLDQSIASGESINDILVLTTHVNSAQGGICPVHSSNLRNCCTAYNNRNASNFPVKFLVFLYQDCFNDSQKASSLLNAGGITPLQLICLNGIVDESFKYIAKELLLYAMNQSEYIRNEILASWLSLASDFSASFSVIPSGTVRPMIPINDTTQFAALCDIELKSREIEKNSTYRVASSILWARCPGMRCVLQDYWENSFGSDSPSKLSGLEITVDASESVLTALIFYLHTGVLLPPSQEEHSIFTLLDLCKISNELSMKELQNLTSQNIVDVFVNQLSCSSPLYFEALSYCADENLLDLQAILVRVAETHYPKDYYNKSDRELNLATATSQDSAELCRLQEESLLFGDMHLNSLDDIAPFNTNDNKQSKSRKFEGKKNKPGEIYALLLQGCEEYESPREVVVPSTNVVTKWKGDRPAKSKAKSKSPALQPIEYDPKNHSIEPVEPEPTGSQKWINELSKPKRASLATNNEQQHIAKSTTQPQSRKRPTKDKVHREPPNVTPTVLQESCSKPDLVNVRSSLKFLKKRSQYESEEQINQDVASVGDAEVIATQESSDTRIKETTTISKVKAGAKISSAIITSKNSRWRQQSLDLRQAINAVRGNGEISQNKPADENAIPLGMIKCPHCSRKFNEESGNRHIAICQNLKSKPATLKKGSGAGGGKGMKKDIN